jgi:hypothetical protein
MFSFIESHRRSACSTSGWAESVMDVWTNTAKPIYGADLRRGG